MVDKASRAKFLEGRRLAPETLMMGYGYRPALSEGSLKPPLFLTSAFVFRSAQDGKSFFELAYGLRQRRPGEELGLIYSRINNPDLEILEDRLAIWDDAERSLVFSSGMSAISTSLWAYARPGAVILHSEPVYGGTDFLLKKILPQFGILAIGFSAAAGATGLCAAAERARKAGPVAALFIETPANPTNAVVDIAAIRAMAERFEGQGRRPPVIVDNTLLGPLFQSPLCAGADIVVTSLTKYVGGHSDLIAGNCSGSAAMLEPVHAMRTILGTTCDPHTGWLLMRSLETLQLRMTASARNAQQVAEFLRAHPRVAVVRYLGFLPHDHPDRETHERQAKGAGSTFSFELAAGGEEDAFAVLNRLKVIKLAVSLGGTESLASHPATMTHSDIAPDEQLRLGITPGLIRLSIGIERVDDLIADLEQALHGAGEASSRRETGIQVSG